MSRSKNRQVTLLLAFISVALLVISYYKGIGIVKYAAFLMMFVAAGVSINDDRFSLLLFLLPWAPVIKLKPGTTSIYSILIIFILLITIIKEKAKFTKKHCLLIILIGLVTMFSKWVFNNSISISYLFFIIMLFAFPMIFPKGNKELDLEKNAMYFALGIITAALSAEVLVSVPGMLEYIDLYEWEKVGLVRLSGFYGDANFYSAQIIAAISALIIVLIKMKNASAKQIFMYIALIALLIYCGLLSVSKSFFLLLAVNIMLFVLAVCFMIKNVKLKIGIILTIIISTVIIGCSGIFNEQLEMYKTRFNIATDSSGFTTGRTDIYIDYLNMFVTNPEFMIFGQGFSNILYSYTNGRAAHNTLIQLIYQFGLIGSVLILVWIYEQFKLVKTEIKILENNGILKLIAIIGCFAPWVALDILFFDDFFMIMFLYFSMYKYIEKESIVIEEKKEENISA